MNMNIFKRVINAINSSGVTLYGITGEFIADLENAGIPLGKRMPAERWKNLGFDPDRYETYQNAVVLWNDIEFCINCHSPEWRSDPIKIKWDDGTEGVYEMVVNLTDYSAKLIKL